MSDTTREAFVWPSGATVGASELTEEQWASAERIKDQWSLTEPVTIIPGLGYVGIDTGRMFLGIEPDGHTHS